MTRQGVNPGAPMRFRIHVILHELNQELVWTITLVSHIWVLGFSPISYVYATHVDNLSSRCGAKGFTPSLPMHGIHAVT